MRWWVSGGASAAAIGLALGGCTDFSNEAAPPTTSEPSNSVAADPTRAACSNFETMWIELAQIDRSRLGSPEPDPHGTAALEAGEQAFEAAAQGSQAAKRLGADAEALFNAGEPADFNAKVTEFFETVCGIDPPEVDCEPQTLCAEQQLDSYG